MSPSRCAPIPRRVLMAGAASLIAGVAPIALAEEADVGAYLGAYRHVGGDKEREARDKAIDDVVAGMSFLVRNIARDRLRAANPIAAAITIARTAKSLTITMDTRSYTGPLDGSKTKVKSISGDDMDMHFDISKKSLTQMFDGDGKGRTNIFTLTSDTRLDLKVRVYAEQLPKDLVYRLSYERA